MIITIFWILFFIFILGAAGFDLFLHGRNRELSLKEASVWTLIWISLAVFFGLLIYLFLGHEQALEYFTAYLLEKSLSLDNLFVFLVIFSFFDLPITGQQKVLKWGIFSAFILRAVFIFGGIFLLNKYDFLFYFFGAFLVYTGIKMILRKEKNINPQKNLFLKYIKKLIPVTDDIEGEKFFIKKPGLGHHVTPLFLALILIESSDVLFATDSVPAVLAVTQNPFIAYTSNAFAILGLRALYFLLANLLPRFVHLKKGIIIILIFIGFKMILSEASLIQIPLSFSLIFILVTISASVLLSFFKNKKSNNIGIEKR